MNEPAPRSLHIITAILLVAFVFLCVLFVQEYNRVRRIDEINSYKSIIDNMRHHKALTQEDVHIIESWMTFRYLNVIFNIPSDYLRDALQITDTRYPNLTIGRLAKDTSQDPAVFAEHVRTAVTHYFSITAL